jgi:hypothetical protein
VKPTILTASGVSFNLLEPDISTVNIYDIAHGLSHLCRFTGHTKTFYSVAEHSLHCSYLVEQEHALCALLHDATEAFVGDVSTPLKSLLPDYRAIEDHLWFALATRFHMPMELPASVKRADLTMLATEKRDLMPGTAEVWAQLAGVTPLTGSLTPMHPEVAKFKFLSRFLELWPIHLSLHLTPEPAHV